MLAGNDSGDYLRPQVPTARNMRSGWLVDLAS